MYAGKSLRHCLAIICLILIWPLINVRADITPIKPAEQLAADVTVGEAQWLEADGERFLAIYTKSTTGSNVGGAIILPSLGNNPDWPDVIAPLRKALPDHGWSTLSVDLPVPGKGTDGLWQLTPYFAACRNRIQSAINYMQQQGTTNILLIGYGLGAAAAAVSVSGTDPLKVSGLAAISLGVPPGSDPKPYTPDLLGEIHIPVFDIFGSRDFSNVTATAAARVAAARRGGLAARHAQQLDDALKRSPQARLVATNQNGYIAYRQLKLMGADHTFRGAEPTLIKRIEGWLKKHS
jgi:pimeloyl-ACP methyl ester carboxylesterase